jgi:hypothetical protein
MTIIRVLGLFSIAAAVSCRGGKSSSVQPAVDGAGAAWLAAPQVPLALAAPPGARLAAHFHATGAQIYECRISAQGAPAWSLKAPDATLFDERGTEMGSHGAGPSWSLKDGSRVTARKVAQADAPRASAIHWLLLEVTSAPGVGVLSSATHVQRVATVGGKTPPDGCLGATLDSEVRVRYSAEYYFYAGGRPGADAAATDH